MRVVIFGVSGNSGRYLCAHFLEQGHDVLGVSRNSSGITRPGYQEVLGDIRNLDTFRNIAGEFDLAVNFAGIQPSILSYGEGNDRERAAREYVDINIVGALNVIAFVRERDIPVYVYASTHRELENHWSTGSVLRDDLDVSINVSGDHAIYAVSKVTARWAGEYLLGDSNTRHFSLRLPMMFQIPREPEYLHNGTKKLMPFLKIIRDAIAGGPLEIWGNPDMRRDYVHVHNLVQMIELCADSDLESGTFNVGTGEGVTTERFVRELGNAFAPNPSTLEYVYRPELKTYKSAVYDVSVAKTKLQYNPILLEEMVQRLKEDFEKKDSMRAWGW